jgi:hypothetical protein
LKIVRDPPGFSHKSDIAFHPQEAEQEIASKSIYFDVIYLRGLFERVMTVPCLGTESQLAIATIAFKVMFSATKAYIKIDNFQRTHFLGSNRIFDLKPKAIFSVHVHFKCTRN